MNTLTHPDKPITIEVPSHWDECSPQDIRYIFRSVLTHSDENKLINVQLFYRLAGIVRSWRTILWEKIMPDHMVRDKNANAVRLADELTSWIYDDTQKLQYTTVFNHFSIIRLKGIRSVKLLGPADLLSDISFGEFRAALEELDDYYSLCHDEVSPKEIANALNRFLACIYRPERRNSKKLQSSEGFDGFIREPFNRNLIEKNTRITSRIPDELKMIILMWFTWCVKYIQTEELLIGGRTISLKSLFPKPKESKKQKDQEPKTQSGWSSILYQVAKDGPFGKVEETDKVALFDILVYLFDQHQENQRLKLKYASKTKRSKS